jgi:hypothetical protein
MIPLLAILPWAGLWSLLPLAGAPTAPSSAPAAETAAAPLSLAAELEALETAAPSATLAPAPVATLQGTVTDRRPIGFVSIGAHVIEGDVRSPTGDDPEYDETFSIDLGFYTWNDSLGLALELGYLPSSYELDTSSLGSEDVDVRRYLLGLRFADDEPDSFFLYYLRAGAVMREDDGDSVEDDGLGWYAGGGIEWKFGRGFSLGPSLLYSETDSMDSSEWILGLQAAYSF